MRICPTCGEENSPELKYCSSCGTMINKNGTTIEPKQELVVEEKKASKSSKSNKLSNIHLGYFVVALIVLGVVILTASGVFNYPKVAANTNKVQSQTEVQKGVNLGMMNEINELQQKFDKDPNDYQSLLKQGHLLSDSRLFEKAIEKYNVYLKKFPSEVDVLIDKGYCLFELKRYNDAIEVFNKGLKLNPKHQIGTFNAGIVYLNMGKDQEAEEYFKKASEIDPNSEIGKKAIDLLKSH
ncbi:MAG: tetratricopeptide repeat protein [Melioribacteraceae bacterium]|nr:tetratricopeptide repeat protein [Melioribacteraceae bacterium]